MRRALAAVICVTGAHTAAAAPSLPELLDASRRVNLDVREQSSVIDERAAAARVERGALWPRVSASADYLRNQNAVVVDIPRGAMAPLEATITPTNQLDATFQLDVPLVDLGARRRTVAADRDLDASRATREVTATEVERSVVRAYFQWVGGTALLTSTRAARDADADDVKILETRFAAGLVQELDVARARSQVARADQTLAEAQLTIATARRTLRTLTGIDPGDAAPALSADTSAEAPLEHWLATTGRAPEVASAAADARAAEARETAARWSYAPTVAALARERFTNAAGFGNIANWTVGVTATWALDRATWARADQSAGTAATSRLRIAHASQDVHDRIVDAWNQIDALRARTAAASAQADADHLAEKLAVAKLGGGQATRLDVVLAKRDALDSDVALVQARADLAAARALLRLAAGRQP